MSRLLTRDELIAAGECDTHLRRLLEHPAPKHAREYWAAVRRKESHERLWSEGLARWIDRWTPFVVSGPALLAKGDAGLRDLLILVRDRGSAISA